jgi:hypothetical protein
MAPDTPQTWWVRVDEKVYGPYSIAQMNRFIGEGRVVATTLLSAKADGEFSPAHTLTSFRSTLHEQRTNFQVQRADRRKPADTANVLVWAELMSNASRRFENELHQLGAVAEIIPGLYILRTRNTAGVVRNALSQVLDRGDKFLVMDSTRDRLAWFNLGPEVDARIREVWSAPVPAQEAI